jgi:hypothetical protein
MGHIHMGISRKLINMAVQFGTFSLLFSNSFISRWPKQHI